MRDDDAPARQDHRSSQSDPSEQPDTPHVRASRIDQALNPPDLVLRLEAAATPSFAEFPTRLDPPIFDEIAPSDEFYPLAEWAWWYAPGLPLPVRQYLYMALALVWPSAPHGDRKDAFMRRLYAWRLKEAGATIEQIARAFCVQPDTARRWVKAGRDSAHSIEQGGPEPRVEPVTLRDDAPMPEPTPGFPTAFQRYITGAAPEVRAVRELDRESATKVALAIEAIESEDELDQWAFAWTDDRRTRGPEER